MPDLFVWYNVVQFAGPNHFDKIMILATGNDNIFSAKKKADYGLKH